MNPSTLSSSPAQSRLAWLPVGLFASVMGLTGLALAWRAAQGVFGTSPWISHAIGTLAVADFVVLALAYALKASTGFAHVRAEFEHPIAGNLFGTPLISVLLIPLLLADFQPGLARGIWVIGAVAMTLFAWLMLMRWISVRQQPTHATPVWIVPVVGMLDVPLALPALGWNVPLHGLMLFATTVGLFFGIPLFTLIVSRLMFDEPLPPTLHASLLILVAPFSVGFSAYVATVGAVDEFAAALYMLALFVLAVLLGRLWQLRQTSPFRLSWWAASFPLAASATAALKYAAFAHHAVADGMAIALLLLATLAIGALTLRTLWGWVRGDLQALSG